MTVAHGLAVDNLTGELFENTTLPIVFNDTRQHDVSRWYSEHRHVIDQQLQQFGAVLFRNFKVDSLKDFESFTQSALGHVAKYVGAATPRTQLTQAIATSTEFPADQEIKLHNELSYEQTIPERLLFCCLDAPQTGGQTQLADVNAVYQAIDPQIIEEFERKGGWRLIRNYDCGFGPDVLTGFGTTDKDAIKADCEQRDVKVEFLDTGVVRTIQNRPAVRAHAHTGLPLWINHIAFWHVSSLDPEQREILTSLFAIDELPYATLFGDGSEIPDEYIDNIRSAYRQSEVTFDWHQGDVLLLDNYRVAHGRKPFTGSRQIVVSMGN